MDRERTVSRSPETARLGALRVGVGRAGIPIFRLGAPLCGGPGLFRVRTWGHGTRGGDALILRMGDKYRIHGTENCWQVEEFGGTNKDGTPRWKALAWHVSLESAVASLADHRIRSIPDSALANEVVKTLKAIRQDVTEALTLFKKAV